MNKAFAVMQVMNYAYDNPNLRKDVKIDEKIVDIASKSVIDPNTWEDITLFASMSNEENAYKKAMDNYKNSITMNEGIKKVTIK